MLNGICKWVWKQWWVEHHYGVFTSILPGYCRRVARCGMDLIKEANGDFGKALKISFVVLVIEFSIKFLFGVFPSV